MKSAN